MYKPRFCTECGGRIERSRWRLWHSRQFCDVCATKQRFVRLTILGLLLATGFLLGFVAGMMSQRPASRPSPPLQIERVIPSQRQKETEEVRRTSSVDRRSTFCGALTRRGTPCRRRVPPGTRCWQHRRE
jgi:hypothetical protein